MKTNFELFNGTFEEYKALIMKNVDEKVLGFIDFDYLDAMLGAEVLEAQDGMVGVRIYIDGFKAMESAETKYLDKEFTEELVVKSIEAIDKLLETKEIVMLECLSVPVELTKDYMKSSRFVVGKKYRFIDGILGGKVLIENYFPEFTVVPHSEKASVYDMSFQEHSILFG